MIGIYVINRRSYIKARIIKIVSKEPSYIEKVIRLANDGISNKLSSHSRTPDGYQMFLNFESDGELICQQILDTLLCLPNCDVIIERINC
jgi:hypothetical protein